MSAPWFYEADGQFHGPYSDRELRDLALAGILRPEMMIQREGDARWQKAASLGKLFAPPGDGAPPRARPAPASATATATAAPPPLPPPVDDWKTLLHKLPDGAPAKGGRIVARTAGDLATDPRKLTFAAHVAVLWGLPSILVLGVFAKLQGVEGAKLAGVLIGLWTWLAFAALVAGISRMIALELQTGVRHGPEAAWGYVGRNALGLLFTPFLASLALQLVFGGITFVIFAVAQQAPAVGGALIVPVFLFALAYLLASPALILLLCVMGFEDCGGGAALATLARLARRVPYRLIAGFFAALLGIVPTILISALAVALALYSTLRICVGPIDPMAVWQGESFAVWITAGSVALIVFAWLDFIAVVLSCHLTLIYSNASGD